MKAMGTIGGGEEWSPALSENIDNASIASGGVRGRVASNAPINALPPGVFGRLQAEASILEWHF
jgi:hypothetical protein